MAVAKLQPEPAPYLRIFIPGKPCSVNTMYVTGRGSNKYSGRRRSDAGVAWENTIWAYTLRHMASQHLRGGTQLKLPLRIDVELFRLRKNADPDNFLKAICDGLKHALGVDDRFYNSVTARRGTDSRTQLQGCMLTVWEAS
jgi:Holliday junction resolvase RusA-like endonuclease